jgi:hypothetical protein
MTASGRVRRSTFPQEGDTWETIAERELDAADTAAAVSQLQSWNLHVFMRPAAPEGSPRHGNPILPSDVIFLEPPGGAS